MHTMEQIEQMFADMGLGTEHDRRKFRNWSVAGQAGVHEFGRVTMLDNVSHAYQGGEDNADMARAAQRDKNER